MASGSICAPLRLPAWQFTLTHTPIHTHTALASVVCVYWGVQPDEVHGPALRIEQKVLLLHGPALCIKQNAACCPRCPLAAHLLLHVSMYVQWQSLQKRHTIFASGHSLVSLACAQCKPGATGSGALSTCLYACITGFALCYIIVGLRGYIVCVVLCCVVC